MTEQRATRTTPARLVAASLVFSLAVIALTAASSAAPISGESAPTVGGPVPDVRVLAADPRLDAAARELSGYAPRLVARASERLGLRAPQSLTVVLAFRPPTSPEDRRRLGLPEIPGWAAGVAQPRLRRVVLFTERAPSYPHGQLGGVLAHEAAHVMLGSSVPPTVRIPRWYSEGLAMIAEREVSFADALQLARMTIIGHPVPFESLDRDWPEDAVLARAAYAQSFSFVSFSEGQGGAGGHGRLVVALRRGATFEEAYELAYGARPGLLANAWRRHVSWRYLQIPLIAAGAAINTVMGLLALWAFVAVRRRRRRILAEWDEQERWMSGGDERFDAPGRRDSPSDFWPPRA